MKMPLTTLGLTVLLTGLAWGDIPHTPTCNTASAVAAGAAGSKPVTRGNLMPPRSPQGQGGVIELEPIGGSLKKGLPKYGPGWRLDPIISIPGMNSAVQNGSATGPR